MAGGGDRSVAPGAAVSEADPLCGEIRNPIEKSPKKAPCWCKQSNLQLTLAAHRMEIAMPATPTSRAKPGAKFDALKNFDDLPDAAFVRLPVVVALDASSSATIWRKVKAKHFPAPVKLSERATAWNVGALRRHFATLAGGAQ